MAVTQKTLAAGAAPAVPGDGAGARFAELHRGYPTIYHLRERARRRLPGFAFEAGDGGAGADLGIRRNWGALDAVELMPRYGVTTSLPPTDTELFGQRLGAPIGVAPMGSPGIVWPGADQLLAAAAQQARVPYCLSTVSGMSIEEAGKIAPDSLWFQLYRYAKNEHAVGLDLMRRAHAAGARVLVLTLDTPIRTTRTREVLSGITTPFRFTPKMVAQVLASPSYLSAFLSKGIPRFGNLIKYVGENAGINEVARFNQQEIRGAFTWEDVARFRDVWKRPLVLKGILHPQDALKAVSLGVDGIQVSNHGGRQVEALPAAIDALPGIVAAANGRSAVLFDSGVRSGLDVVRAVALGADFVFAGKAFLWGLGALGEEGPAHTFGLFADEIRAALGQIGARSVAEARAAVVRHPGSWRL
ncbi:MAG: alpha-hydroxy-acid oxidizing protein [Burkholderiales bacterium]|nr:alpha-hydroxy-acid oxidizing protein [Burkholderiales bacterium]